MKNVIVYVEQRNGSTRKVTFEMVTQARTIADALGGSVTAVVLGAGAMQVAQRLAAFPIDTISVVEDPAVESFLLDPVVQYVELTAKNTGPSLLMIPNTLSGRDLAGRLVARLHAGIAADVTEVHVVNGRVECVSPKFGGAQITRCALRPADFGIVTVRPGAFAVAPSGSGASISRHDSIAASYALKIENDVEEGAGEMALEEAPVVIAGGRGLGGAEPFTTLLKPLADAFGGAVGASRAAADAGWVSYSLQIGQTGKTVSPPLYIAVGISGAIQHKVGMRASGTIVAINKDGSAPIAEFADLTVVGDAFAILPELTKLVQAARQ